MSPFEEMVRALVGVARLHARSLERALWVVLVVLLAAMLAAGITKSLG